MTDLAETETRAKSFIHLLGDPLEGFEGRMLPTSKEVLLVYFYRHKKEKMTQKSAVNAVAAELEEVWAKARIPISEHRNVVHKLDSLVKTYRNICRNKKRGGDAQKVRELYFTVTADHLFEIAHHDAFNIIKIGEDKRFLMDQRSERRYVMGGVDKKLSKKEANREFRVLKEEQRRLKEEERKTAVSAEMVGLLSSSEDTDGQSDDNPPDNEEEFVDSEAPSTSRGLPKRRRISASKVVSHQIASALDRTNISDRKAAFILSAAAQTYSVEETTSNISLSRSSIRRIRSKHRAHQAAKEKSEFQHDGPLVLHFDGKLLPAISGGAEKEDRMAIIVTGENMEKILGIPKVNAGTGEQIAQVSQSTLIDWNLQDQVIAMSFDTTAANTGKFNGACVLLEQKLQRKMLWLACRHHILEIMCGKVFTSLFGPTSGPNQPIFRRFQQFWPSIEKEDYAPCTDIQFEQELLVLKSNAVEFCKDILLDRKGYVPREDYRELLELSLIFLGEVPPRGVNFRVPGAFHHARWMSKVIYILKIYLFREQFKLTAGENKACLEFALFVVMVYVKHWITSSISVDAPANDLCLVKTLISYGETASPVISTSAIKAISRHLWYLGEELAPLGLFSEVVKQDTKRQMVARLLQNKEPREYRSIRYIGNDDFRKKSLDSFIGPASHFFFSALGLDTSFLEEDVDIWEKIPSYLESRRKVMGLKVVNDCAERGIALATTFNKSITKNEEQKQFLFQMVERHRKSFPNAKKSTLKPPE